MPKRSAFARKPHDLYETVEFETVIPLLPHLAPGTVFTSPCAGPGRLIAHLERAGHRCALAYDLQGEAVGQRAGDARVCRDLAGTIFIENPPWSRALLHPIIRNLASIAPTWLLFDADWMHTGYFSEFEAACQAIVAVGGARWFEETPYKSMDKVAWYLFDAAGDPAPPRFYGRRP